MKHKVICPYCDKEAELMTGEVIYPYRQDLHQLKFWLCNPCGAYVGCHKRDDGTEPLGRLANAELRRWKSTAHRAFDPLWKTGKMSRNAAYLRLAKAMNMPVEQCHIGMFNVDQCQEVVFLIKTGAV